AGGRQPRAVDPHAFVPFQGTLDCRLERRLGLSAARTLVFRTDQAGRPRVGGAVRRARLRRRSGAALRADPQWGALTSQSACALGLQRNGATIATSGWPPTLPWPSSSPPVSHSGSLPGGTA